MCQLTFSVSSYSIKLIIIIILEIHPLYGIIIYKQPGSAAYFPLDFKTLIFYRWK